MSFFTITERDKRDARIIFPSLFYGAFYGLLLYNAGAPGWVAIAIIAHVHMAHWFNQPVQS